MNVQQVIDRIIETIPGGPISDAVEHKLAVWRFHDYAHTHEPDLIYAGIERGLGWVDYRVTAESAGSLLRWVPADTGIISI